MFVTVVIALCAVAIGVLSAILPLGPVAVLVLRRALCGDHGGALRIGFGRAPVETFYCSLATFGVVALLDRFPGARVGVETTGVLVFAAIGVWLMFQRPQLETPEEDPDDPDDPIAARRRRWGDWSGFIISLLNPSLLLSWSAIVAIAVSMAEFEPTLADKIAFPVALGLGIVLGYLILVGLLRRFGALLEARVIRRVLVVMGVVFVGVAIWNGLGLLGLT